MQARRILWASLNRQDAAVEGELFALRIAYGGKYYNMYARTFERILLVYVSINTFGRRLLRVHSITVFRNRRL